MRMHEWMKSRDRQIRRALHQGEEDTQAAPPADEEQPPAEVPAPEPAPAPTPEPAPPPPEPGVPTSPSQVPATALEVLDSVAPSGHTTRDRLEALLARQGKLPLEIAPEPKAAPSDSRRVMETRDELVERLLDPTLTLQETALLLGVCPTTVRRYTNRGALRCMRTPGNQRRFRLSDILEFMEHRENWN
jgi:excisionase family DNA binding protein